MLILALAGLAGSAPAGSAQTVARLDVKSAAAAVRTRVVPGQYRTIQAAVDAAQPGDEVRILSGTYREQITIGKDLRFTGLAPGQTTIRAPESLQPGEDGGRSIIEIRNGASVAISRLDVGGPNARSCASGPIESGISVLDGSHLDLSLARVVHIHDTPIARCGHGGVGVPVGNLADPHSGSAVIHNSVISDYATKGILVLSAGPDTVTRNVVTGPDEVSSDGIDVLFSTATISHNVVSNNECRVSDPLCGHDFFTSSSTLASLPAAQGQWSRRTWFTELRWGSTRSTAARSIATSCGGMTTSIWPSRTGRSRPTGDRLAGPGGAVAVIASQVDSNVTLTRTRTVATRGAPVQSSRAVASPHREGSARRPRIRGRAAVRRR